VKPGMTVITALPPFDGPDDAAGARGPAAAHDEASRGTWPRTKAGVPTPRTPRHRANPARPTNRLATVLIVSNRFKSN